MRTCTAATFLAATVLAAPLAAQGDRPVLSKAENAAYLVGPEGKPVYLFTTDTRGEGQPAALSCPVECRTVWPPVEVLGELTLGDEIARDMVDTVQFDGRAIVTYNGWPLYTFERDSAGETPRGNHVESFGGEWYLIGADGERIEDVSG